MLFYNILFVISLTGSFTPKYTEFQTELIYRISIGVNNAKKCIKINSLSAVT